MLMMLITVCGWAQTKDSIDTSNIVVAYDYTCHTADKNGTKVDEHYRLAVLVGDKTTWSTGYLDAMQHENKTRKELIAALDEQKLNIPSVYVGHPSADKVTIHETVLVTDYVTEDEKKTINWQIDDDTLTIMGFLCQKATAKVRGREWIAWYTEEMPTTVGPWCLYGCPGLIVKAEADGIHCFELQSLEQKAVPIVYSSSPTDLNLSRSKFVKYRNKTLTDHAHLNSTMSLIHENMIKDVTILQDGDEQRPIINGHSFNMHPNAFQPLDLE